MSYFLLFYVIAKVGNYLEKRIDPIAIIINGDYFIPNWWLNVLDFCEKFLGSIFYSTIFPHVSRNSSVFYFYSKFIFLKRV
jgi:hypothetical protein